jgi:hypothetical protein
MFQFLIPMAANALLSARSAERQQAQQKANNMAQAEMTRYSPWTHQTGQLDMSYIPSSGAAAFGGAVQGLGMGQAIDKAFPGAPAAPNPVNALDSAQKQVYNGIAQPQGMNQFELLAGQPMKQPSMFS